MAKSMAVSLPFVLLLLDLWPLGRWRAWPWPQATSTGDPPDPGGERPPEPGRTEMERPAGVRPSRLIAEKLPLLGLAAAAAVVALRTQAGALAGWPAAPLGMRLANALTS